MKQSLGIFYEHPDWFKPMFQELEHRGINYEKINGANHHFDFDETAMKYTLVFNRMSPSAFLREGVQGIFYTQSFLKYLSDSGIQIINGYQAFAYECSKANQLSLIKRMGYKYPKARVVNHKSQIIRASEGLRFPIVVKANIGGSGAGIVKYNSRAELTKDISENQIDFGIDYTALVQEYIPARGGYITRVETLGGKFLYAIKVFITGDTFNLCPADICQTTDGKELIRNACALDAPKSGLKVEAFLPPSEVITAVERIIQNAKIDVGGIEYIVDDRDGEILYYDINALSNFVADAINVVGFNPFIKLVDFIEDKLSEKRLTKVAHTF